MGPKTTMNPDDPVTLPRTTVNRAKGLLVRLARGHQLDPADITEALGLLVSGIARSDLALELASAAPAEAAPRSPVALHTAVRAAAG